MYHVISTPIVSICGLIISVAAQFLWLDWTKSPVAGPGSSVLLTCYPPATRRVERQRAREGEKAPVAVSADVLGGKD
jgi:hypothetical protein